MTDSKSYTTLVQRLREAGDPGFDPWTEEQMLLQDAASRIEELEAENAELRAAMNRWQARAYSF